MERTLEREVMDGREEVDAYASMDHREANESFVARMVGLGARGRMLDIGTGPGHLPEMVCAAVSGATVVGVDLSRPMLAHARRRRAASPVADRVGFRLGDARHLDFPDASFDAVFSNTVLHHLADPRPMLAEARRVLRAGGVLLLRDLYRPPTSARALELVDRHAAGADERQRELFRASLHAALTPGELRAAAEAVGLADAEVAIDTDRHMSLQIARATAGASAPP